MRDAYIAGYCRTPIGRFAGALASSRRRDDLAAHPLEALRERHPDLDWDEVDDVAFGCANQAGARTTATSPRMALLLAGLPETIPGTTINGSAARAWTPWPSPPGHPRRRGRARHRGRRGEHVQGTLRHAQGRDRLLKAIGDP
jgi:hypothetical protein